MRSFGWPIPRGAPKNIFLEHRHPRASPNKTRNFLRNLPAETSSFFKNIKTATFQMENVPYSDLAAAVELNLKVPTYQKRLTKQRLRNTNRERTPHISVLVIPSSRIINHSVAWSRLIKFTSDITWNPDPFRLSNFCLDATHSEQILQSHLRHSIDVSIPLGSAKAPSRCIRSWKQECSAWTLHFWIFDNPCLVGFLKTSFIYTAVHEHTSFMLLSLFEYSFFFHQFHLPTDLPPTIAKPLVFHPPREPLLLHPKWPSTTLGYWSLAIQQRNFWRNRVFSQSLHPAWYRTTRI